MKKLQLYNSLTNKLEDFVPIDENNVRIYACGPTVYASPHLGNARPLVVFDVLFRALQKLYDTVSYVRNITDVDDKINARAKLRNITIRELTDEVIAEFHGILSKLNVLPVTHEPRATDHINEMLDIIQILIDNGYAYQVEGHVLFRVKRLPNYGQLSKRNLDEMIAGSRIEVAPYKEHPMDFVLWKPSSPDMPAWPSNFGAGRPGWHIECSAMSRKYLGTRFDIHAGGHDLIFPHHENEIAQNFGAFGCRMANYWIHNEMLLVDGQKMSKSLGNIISLADILQQYDGEIVRYVLLSTHYQKKLNWTNQLINQAKIALNRMYGALKMATRCDIDVTQSDDDILDVLCANLNTPLALRKLSSITDEIYKTTDQNEINELCACLKNSANLLGLLQRDCRSWNKQSTEISKEEIEKQIELRRIAKLNKDFATADEIRNNLLKNNVILEDSPTGTTWHTK